ncbi:MAG: EAL domain-containing protein [Pseudomonadota bacterium]
MGEDQNVRPDRVKIDRSLIQSAIHDPVKREVVAAILEMTHALGMETLAEGVETADEVAIIQELGCTVFQGYAYAKPLPKDAFLAYMRQTMGNTKDKRRA